MGEFFRVIFGSDHRVYKLTAEELNALHIEIDQMHERVRFMRNIIKRIGSLILLIGVLVLISHAISGCTARYIKWETEVNGYPEVRYQVNEVIDQLNQMNQVGR